MGSNLDIDYEIQVTVKSRRRAFRNNRGRGIFRNNARHTQPRTCCQVLTTINCRTYFIAFEIRLTPIVRRRKTLCSDGPGPSRLPLLNDADRAETCAHDLDNILLLRVAIAREMSAMKSCGDVAVRLFDLQFE